MCSVAGTRKAELDCSVLEEDWQRGQSYMAHWHSLTLVPDHHHRLVTHTYKCERSDSDKHGCDGSEPTC